MATLIYPLNPDPLNWLPKIPNFSVYPESVRLYGYDVLIHANEKKITHNKFCL